MVKECRDSISRIPVIILTDTHNLGITTSSCITTDDSTVVLILTGMG